MTRMVIEQFELLAPCQGMQSLMFLNRKKQDMIFQNIDMLAGVDGNNVSAIVEEGNFY